jgi:hypothetical protein
VFAGTRLDTVTSGAEHEAISTILYENFSDNLAWRSVVENEDGRDSNGKAVQWFFPVDNKLGKDGPTLRNLMSVVHTAIDRAAYTHKEVPLSWFQTMDRLNDTGKSCLTLAEVIAASASCNVSPVEIPLLLSFLHDMGHLMWLNEPELRDVVILDPLSYLVTPATIIICKLTPDHDDSTHHFMGVHRECDKHYKKEWTQLKQSGVLHVKLLPILWREYVEHTSNLLRLMVKFGLLVPLRSKLAASHTEQSARLSGPTLSSTNSSAMEVTQYLVPTLLATAPHDDPAVLVWTDKPCVTGYFVFTLLDDFADTCTLTAGDLKSSGFLPGGMFERLMGKALCWSQETARGASLNLQSVLLHKDLAVLSFGGQRFRLVHCADIHCVRVDVEGSNPIGIMQKLLDFIVKVTEECMKSLRCFPAVCYHSDPEAAGAAQASDPLGKHLSAAELLIPLQQLRLAGRGESMLAWRGGRALMTMSEIKSRYGQWLQLFERRERYDVFISYRWGRYDTEFTEQVFDMFTNFSVGESNRAVEVFLDRKRLEKGRRFKSDFAAALSHSHVALPVISMAALEKMHDHSSDMVDNVLLEWIIILECAAAKRVSKVYPIVFGSRQVVVQSVAGADAPVQAHLEYAIVNEFFSEFARHPLPDTVPTATLREAAELLRENDVTMAMQLRHYTVRSVVQELLQFLLCCASEVRPAELVETYCLAAVDLVNELDAEAAAAARKATPAPLTVVQPVSSTNTPTVTQASTPIPVAAAAAAHTPVLRQLQDLTAEEVGQLMVRAHLDPLRDIFQTRGVGGMMLFYVEEVSDLLSAEYGLTSKGLARGLLERIVEWKRDGVML